MRRVAGPRRCLLAAAGRGAGRTRTSTATPSRTTSRSSARSLGSGEPDALLQALDVLRDLQDKAPDDISDEWQQVVGRIEALEQALDDAGVDPATYDRDQPPAA